MRALTYVVGGLAAGLCTIVVALPVWPVVAALLIVTGAWLALVYMDHKERLSTIQDKATHAAITALTGRVDALAEELTQHRNAFAAMSNRLGSVTGVGLQAAKGASPFNRLGK